MPSEITVKQTILEASLQLKNSSTAKLDAEILLAFILKKNRTWLAIFANEILSEDNQSAFQVLVEKRKSGIPIAYLIGQKEFWSMQLMVDEDVLIPRPETELLVELILAEYSSKNSLVLADLGTGSGAIAIALAKEKPNWHIYATDISEAALAIARLNAKTHHINTIEFCHGDWCKALPHEQFDIIVSNPPYLSKHDLHLQSDIRFEPFSALVAENDGMADLEAIASQAKEYLNRGGSLWFEHGYNQKESICKVLKNLGYSSIQQFNDWAGQPRVSKAKKEF